MGYRSISMTQFGAYQWNSRCVTQQEVLDMVVSAHLYHTTGEILINILFILPITKKEKKKKFMQSNSKNRLLKKEK